MEKHGAPFPAGMELPGSASLIVRKFVNKKVRLREALPGYGSLISGFWEKSGALLWPQDRMGGGYKDLFRASPWTLAFCCLFVFSSGIGQTFFLSLFQQHWQAEFGISSAQMGTFYGLATLASGLMLPFGGRWLDRTSPAIAGTTVFLGLACTCILLGISMHFWMLGVGLWGVRFWGQGMSATLGTTYAARWFEHNRGRAVSLAGLGYPASEAVMPIAATVGIALMGWRAVWMVTAIALAVFGTALVRFVLSKRLQRAEAGDGVDEGNGFGMQRGKKRMDKSIYRDPRFLLMVGVVAPLPFVGTGVIFFQATLAEIRGWSLASFPAGFMLFAIVRATVSLSAGAWVDRVGALRLIAIPGLAFSIGVLLLLSSNPLVILPFFVLMGVAFGASGAVMTAAFTELFGKDNIGAVRGASSSISVFVTAAAPVLFGWVLTFNGGITIILIGCASLLVILPSCCSLFLYHILKPRPY